MSDLDNLINPEVADAIKKLQLALLCKATKVIEGPTEPEIDPIDPQITAEQLMAMLISVLSGQTTTQQSAELLAALTAQTNTQQGNQQATELIAALTGRTQTETSHTEDINTPERIKAAVARGTDNNELSSQRFNNIAGNVAEVASISLGVLMTSTSVVAAQIQAQVADHGAKNSAEERK
jgi:hypothetical protein